MAQQLLFSRFTVDGLRGNTKIDVRINDNTLIMVGENGSGKTTFLRILFYFLSARWTDLAQFEFSTISAILNDKEFTVSRETLLQATLTFDDRLLRALPPSQRRRVNELISNARFGEAEAIYRNLTSHFSHYPDDVSTDKRREFERSMSFLETLHDTMQNALGAQILYLPTYRRIERELSSIFRSVEASDEGRRTPSLRQDEDANDYVELVEFGMKDVKTAISSTVEDIRSFQLAGATRLSLSYLGDVVNQKYKTTDKSAIIDASNDSIEAVLNRIDETILDRHDKGRLRDIILATKTTSDVPSEYQQIIYYYFTKLLSFQSDLQAKEKNLNLFCEICSTYIVDKIFLYESGTTSFSIRSRGRREEIQLSELSSGEKQIVSLFSHLYLSGRDKFFVLIDEPELSLSVPWQRRFLEDIIRGSFCAGLVAVTHSPFIYDNRLRGYTHALGEFVSGPDWGNIR